MSGNVFLGFKNIKIRASLFLVLDVIIKSEFIYYKLVFFFIIIYYHF